MRNTGQNDVIDIAQNRECPLVVALGRLELSQAGIRTSEVKQRATFTATIFYFLRYGYCK